MLNPLGTLAKVVFTGSEDITSSATNLKRAVDNYHQTLTNIHVRISLKVYEVLKGDIDSSDD